MSATGRTIQIFLPSGEPRGVRIAEFTTRIVQAVAFPRSKLEEALRREELTGIGTYFLIGEREDDADDRPIVYIGEAEDCSVRFRQHNAEKEFWQTAVAIVSRTQSFTKAHIRLLEYMSIQRTRAAERYVLDNGNSGTEPFLPEHMRAEVCEVFETMESLLSALGFPLFEPVGVGLQTVSTQPPSVVRPPGNPLLGGSNQTAVFAYRGDGFSAKLIYNEDGFVVLNGSVARTEVFPSGQSSVYRRDQLLRDGVLTRQADGLHFTRDHAFKSPSGAADVISGISVNGWEAWKDDRGRTLHDVYRKAADQ
ncbi:MAG TPA: GIY-YIG nuclease family protein [Phycisphaerales bacterium]|nr:GIY-YIG nuclease family protein [Phycisphaerales bacterium]